MIEAMTTAAMVNDPSVRTRRGRKRLVFQPPRQVPRSVRSLWESASAEERAKAHTTCVEVLSMWLGHKSRQSVARELSLPPLRVWQLSQAALSGMLAGLLKQPRGRGRSPHMEPSEDDPRVLKKRVAELLEENHKLRELVEVLRNLPPARVVRPEKAPKAKSTKKPKTEKKVHGRNAVQRGAEGGGGTAPGAEGSTPR